MQIMVRTRGLGRALGRAIGKVLGRRDESDDDAPQRRRPTASAHRQRQQQTLLRPRRNWSTTSQKHLLKKVLLMLRVLGGPHDTSVLTDFEKHIALRVWNEEECPELKLSSHGRKMTKFGRSAPEIEGLVVANGLSPLIVCVRQVASDILRMGSFASTVCSLDTGDQGLISAFVEHWHKETSSFHLPVEEVTITLDDVALLLRFPVVGVFHTFKLLHVDNAVEMLVELLKREHIYCICLDTLRDLTQSGGYAWGTVVLVHMYDNLNNAFKSTVRQIAGYITLLQDDIVAIADRLDRLLNLRMLTEGKKVYVIVEECVGIARRYIGQPTVGQ
ncbi:Protein MAIN-LIKE 2 [Glycine soja]